MKKWVILLFVIIFGFFFINTFHEEYPDEYDSIVGGLYIDQGKLPYRDWFQHHNPGAYVLSAILLPFVGQSFVKFRMALAVAFFLINFAGYWMIKKRVKGKNIDFYVFFLLITAIAGTYFWGHMLLADTLSAYLIIPAYALLLIKDFFKEKFEKKDLFFVGLFTFLSWFTSMTLTYAIAGLNIYALYLFFRSSREHKESLKKTILDAGIALLTPYLVFATYLLLSGSIKDYYFANVTYNQNYYIYNYPRPYGAPVNPIRYAVVIANTFINNYLPALWGVAGFPIGDPLQVTLALSSAVLAVILLIKKRFTFLFPFLILLIYSTSRSNPQAVKVTDYQASTYLLTSFFNGIFSLWILKSALDSVKEKVSNKVVYAPLFFVLGLFWFFSTLYLFLKFTHTFNPKYMGLAATIYDRPDFAPLINKMIGPNDYTWIGPFKFKELFYLNTSNIASRHHWFLNHAVNTKIKDEILKDFERTKPKVVVFDRKFAPWGGDASTYNYFFADYLNKNYFRLYKLNETLPDYKYVWKVGDSSKFDIDDTFYFILSRKDEILAELMQLGYVEKVAK